MTELFCRVSLYSSIIKRHEVVVRALLVTSARLSKLWLRRFLHSLWFRELTGIPVISVS